VRVSAGLAQSSTDIDVVAGPATNRTIALNAGLLTVAAPHSKGGAGSASATIVIASKAQGTGAPTLLSGNVADLVVPAGSWTITAADGAARASRTIAVASGARVDAEIPLAAGRLRLDAGRTPAADILYVVTEDDPESPNGRREIVRSLAPAPEFVLPAGSYTVFARGAGGEVRETLTLRPGDDVSRTINLQTGRLALVSRLTGPGPADPDLAPSWRVIRGDDGREAARATDFAPTFELAAGRYRVEGRVGGQNAIVSRDVDIKGGGEQRLQVDLPAGRIRLKSTDATAGLVLADVYWEISDDRGRVVWRTGQAQPSLVLASGRYKVRLEMRERSSEAAFEVKAGDNRTIEVTPG
jgi:Ca-activated chloride channel family protein